MSEKLSSSIGMNAEDFKTGVAQLNRELRVVKSEFAATASTFSDWTKDIDGLEARTKSLNSQIEIQGQKVNATRAEFERMVAAHGADSRAAQEAEVKYNNETATLNKMNTELTETEKAMDEVKNSSEKAGDGVKEMGNKSETLKKTLAGVTAGIKLTAAAMMAMIGVMLAVTAAIGGLVFASAAAADDLGELSEQTGISTQKLQEMAYTGKQVGTSLETFTGSQAKMIKSMQAAREGTGAQADAFAALGINVTDAGGKLRDSETVFGETLDALKKIQDPTERDAMAMQIFGKSAQELNPLINAGSDGLAAYAKKAQELGAVVDKETVESLGGFQDQLDGIKDGLAGSAMTIAGVFLPGFAGIADQVESYVKDLATVVQGSRGIGGMADGISKLFVQIAKNIAETAPQMLQAGVDVMSSVTKAILDSLPKLVPAATGILNSLIKFLGDSLPIMIDAGIAIVLALVNTILPQLPYLVDVALKAIVTLANGLTAALPKLLPTVAKVIVAIVKTLVDNLPLVITAALQLLIALAQGLILALPILITAIPEIITALIKAFTDSGPLLAQAAGELIGLLAIGLVGAIPLILFAMVDIGKALFTPLPKNHMQNLGSLLIGGMWKGIQGGWAAIAPQFNALFKKSWDDGIKGWSTYFAGVSREFQKSWDASMIGWGNFFTGLSNAFSTAWSDALTGWGNFFSGLSTQFSTAWTDGLTGWGTFLSGIAGKFDDIFTDLYNAGGKLVSSVWDGIKKAWDQLVIDLQGLIDALPAALLSLLGLNGESGGLNINAKGFGKDLLNEMSGVQNKLRLSAAGLAVGEAGAGTYGNSQKIDNSLHLSGTIIFQGPQTPGTIGAAVRQQKSRRY